MPADEVEGEGGRSQNSVQVIARAADILRALEGEPDGLSLAQIAARVGMARSTVHRLAVGLANEGFVIPASPNGRVRLGPLLARLGAASRRDIQDELRPFMRRLADEVEETVDVACAPSRVSAPPSRCIAARTARPCWRRSRVTRPSGCCPGAWRR
jgi:biotin operon repressor